MAADRRERGRLALRRERTVDRTLGSARPVGRHRRGAHGRARRERRRHRGRQHRMPGADVSLGRRTASAGDPARACASATSSAWSRWARPTRGPGSTSASGACRIRSARTGRAAGIATPYAFLPIEGESLHQIPVGPVHAGIIEPGHFRFTANGETVVRLEQRLGYVHKGIEALMAGATLTQRRGSPAAPPATARSPTRSPSRARSRLRSASRLPPRAVYLRALMAELERLANHFGDIGAICNDASFSIMHAQCGILREQVLRAADACFGHRLMMDRVVPGGVARDLGAERARRLLERCSTRSGGVFPRWSSSTTTPPRCRTAPSRPASCAPSWRANSAPAAMSAAPPAAPSMRAGGRAIRPTIGSNSTCRCSTRATSMRASGSASARSSRASG